MAITYLVGIPRSGKSYYAVFQLWKYFVFKPKKGFFSRFIKSKSLHNYNFAYTNINEFDFSKSDKFKKLDFDDLRLKLTELYNLYIKKVPDSELLDKAKEFNLYNVLIVIDEVHNFLGDKVDDVLKWWLTYHGHLFQDLFLITQDLSLVATQYKNNAEFFYRAVPPSNRLSTKKFRYTQYINARMAMNGKIKDFTIPALKDVFDMYVSGAENKSKSVVHKYIRFSILLFLLLIVFGFYAYNSLFADKVETKKTLIKDVNSSYPVSNINSNVSQINNAHRVLYTDNGVQSFNNLENKSPVYKLFEVDCFDSDICKYKDSLFPRDFLKVLIDKNKNDKFFYVKRFLTLDIEKYYLFLKENSFNFIDFRGSKNEKNVRKKSNRSFSNLKLL